MKKAGRRMTHEALAKSDDVKRFDTKFNADMLKALAMAIMLIDHIGAFLIDRSDPLYSPLRSIGRLAFPIFCFLIAEGAYYTRSMPKYLARLAAFALISAPPYNLVHGSAWNSPDNVNVFFTLFLGLAAIYSMTELPKTLLLRLGKCRLSENRGICAALGLPLCALCYMTAYGLDTDYGEYGVAAILIFWMLRKNQAAAWLSFTALTFVFFEFFIATPGPAGGVEYSRMNLYNVLTKLLSEPGASLYFFNQTQMYAPLAFIPCLFYNGKRGNCKGKYAKYLFYAFYPAHLFCLWIVQLIIR